MFMWVFVKCECEENFGTKSQDNLVLSGLPYLVRMHHFNNIMTYTSCHNIE